MDIEKAIQQKGLTLDNYLFRLDEMTDEEITYMLDLDEGKALMDEARAAQPNLSDRKRAEFMRYF
jgi:hypothetical protein